MIRARAGTRHVLRPAILLLVADLAAAACGSSATPTTTPQASILARTASPSTVAPIPTLTAMATRSPRSTATTRPTPSASGALSAAGGAAASCTGSADTKDFFTAIAEAVGWPVYCAVLPAGWSVEAGQYRLADGGRMIIAYRTRTGGHLELREGRWCTAGASACSPHDATVGPARFGDLSGQLETLGDDLVLYANPGQPASWTAIGQGLDEATFRSLCAGFDLVRS